MDLWTKTRDMKNMKELSKEFERKFPFQSYMGSRNFEFGVTPADIWNWIKVNFVPKQNEN